MRIWIPLTLLALAGCGSHGTSPLTAPTPTPTASLAPVAATLGAAWNHPAGTTAAVGLWDLTLDTGTLNASATLRESDRQVQQNDDLYLLPISNFLKADSFRVIGVSGAATTITIRYEFTHPFPAPSNPAGTPNGFSNRADLGFAGVIAFLFDVPTATGNTYFTDVVANTALMTNADGYLRPRAMISTTGTANTFPYKLVVDERGATGNRVGISNDGATEGNYGTAGWTRALMGSAAPYDKWTGFGVLHQGQRAANTLVLDRASLGTGTVALTAAVIAHYVDPRGGSSPAERFANRLPPASPDALTKMAYRMPHGAWDNQRVVFEGESGGFVQSAATASTLRFHVEDWDARANESTNADLSQESNPKLVAQGESGLPALSVCIPGVLGDATVHDDWDPQLTITQDDSGFGGDPEVDSGHPDDALFFVKSIEKPAGSGEVPGIHTGLVRVTDPEIKLAPGFVTPLDSSLTPLTTDLPQPVTYQAFTVDVANGNRPPTATITAPTEVASGNGVLTLSVDTYNDPDGDALKIRFDWNNDTDYDDTGEGYQDLDGTPPDTFDSPLFYNNASLDPTPMAVGWEEADALVVNVGSTDWMLGPNQPPNVLSGAVSLVSAQGQAPFTFQLSATPLSVLDPEDDAVTFSVAVDGVPPASGLTALDGFNGSPVMGPYSFSSTPLLFRAYANDLLHPTVAGTLIPDSPLEGTVDPGSTTGGWVYASKTIPEQFVSTGYMGRDTDGHILIAGYLLAGGDLGAGPAPTESMFFARLSPTGEFEMQGLLPVLPSTTHFGIRGVGGGPAGSIYVAGEFSSPTTIDFGGGPRSSRGKTDSFIVKYDHEGQYLWDFVTSGTGNEWMTWPKSGQTMAVDAATGDVYFGGNCSGDCQFGPIQIQTGNQGDPFLARLDNNGNAIYARNFPPTSPQTDNSSEMVIGLLLDQAGAIYLTGGILGGTDLGGGGRGADGDWFVFVSKYTARDGSWIWDHTAPAGTYEDEGRGLASDSTRVYCSGFFHDGADFGGGARLSASGNGIFTAAYAADDGHWIWDRTWGDTWQSPTPCCVWADAGQLYVAGAFQETLDFGSGPRTAAGSGDMYLVRLDPSSGSSIWDLSIGGDRYNVGNCLRGFDGQGLVVTGTTYDVMDVDPGPGQALIGQADCINAFVLHLTPDGVF
ncbi:MAG: hypothetical protein ABI743_00765 [bacterium]